MTKGTYAKIDGQWLLKVYGAVQVGDRVIAERKGQGAKYVEVTRIVREDGNATFVATKG